VGVKRVAIDPKTLIERGAIMRSVRDNARPEASTRRHAGVHVRLLVPAIVVLCAVISACEKTPAGTTRVFKCSNGTRVEVVFSEKKESVTMVLEGKSYTLKHIPSGSGAKYSDGKVVFWNKGKGAFIEIGGEVVHDGCLLVE
jgi:membrane-bound inhibitor of C-type lysozyme